MEEQKRKFKKYRTEKRIEISTMSSLIENLSDEFNKKEKNLLISSYIVLTYAYWESCFHKFQDLMFNSYKIVPIKHLPFELKNDVSLSLARISTGSHNKKILGEIKTMKVFESIIRTIEENENNNVVQILEKYHDRVDEKEMRQHFLLNTANPNLERFNDVLKKYGVRLDRIIEEGVNTNNIKKFFSDGLNFIVDQRNSIAHKNEKIIYNTNEYDDYDHCIFVLASEIEFSPLNKTHPEFFINEMNFQIDSFFDLMVDQLEKKIEGLVH